MKALVLTGIKQFEIQELDTPEIQPNEVLINTAYAGVCGTDHDLYAGRPGSAPAVRAPLRPFRRSSSAMRTPVSSQPSAPRSPTSRSATVLPSIRTSTAASASTA